MVALATFIVGVLLGWIVTWMLQKRLDDDLHDEVARLQRELADCQRERGKEQAESGETQAGTESASGAEAELATRAPGAEVMEAGAVAEAAAGTPVEEAVAEPEPETESAEAAVVVAEEEAVVVEEETGPEEEDEVVATRSAAVVEIDAEEEVTPAAERARGVADLTVIKGIGPKFAETLNAAGITSYADLANTPPDRLQEIVQPAAWQKVDFEDWIAQAAALSRQSRRMQIGDDLTRLEGIGPSYAQSLRAAGITSFAQLAESDEESLAGTINAPAWRRVDYASWIAQAKLAAAGDEEGLKELQEQLNARQGDNIGLIQGIGATTLTALTDAGITTYAELAETTPEQLGEIMSNAGVRRGNYEAWIEEAKQRSAGKRVVRGGTRTRSVPADASLSACPQDLGRIEGIGETYEQRLYDSGIGTFWEVSMLSQEDLTEVLEVQAFQRVDLDEIQESARSLAQETDSVGRVWDGTEPDNFEILEGIGEVFEQRLYDAGICTFAALAELSAERLQEICQAHPNFAPNFTRWLEQAREARS